MSEVWSILFIALATASFTNWFDDCLQDGMLFARWGQYVKDKYWLKPLGGCLICTCTWVNIITGIVLFSHYNLGECFLLTSALIGISNTFLKFIIK